MLTYAIGDIHGCVGQLRQLLAEIENHRAGRPRKLVFLGDYIDRGPDSAGVIECLRTIQASEPDDVVCLMGNHEKMMLNAYHVPCERLSLLLNDEELTLISYCVPAERVSWLMNGAKQTLLSFDIDGPEELPSGVVRWARGLPTVHEDARRFYVHAGFRPGAPVPDPDVHVRLWIGKPFLESDHDFGKLVVHGHTPRWSAEPDVRQYRVNLDTACVSGGALTAGVFTDLRAHPIEFLQVS